MAAAFAALVALAAPAVPAFAQERISAPTGISIEKPAGWSVLPPDETVENLRGMRFGSPELERAVQAVRAPFITLIKYPADRAGINPTIKVNYHPLPASFRGRNAVEVLEAVTGSMRAGFSRMELLDAPAPATFGGLPGAHVRIAYVLTAEGGTSVETVSEMWLTLRGDHIVVLGVGYARNEPPGTRAEILAAAASFRIARE